MPTRGQQCPVCHLDLAKKQVRFRHENAERTFEVDYDHLVIALGAVTNFYHTPGLEQLADNLVAALRGQPLKPFKFKIIGLLATIGRRAGVAEILGLQFSGYIAWWLWRGIYLSKLPGLQKKVRVAIDWMLDLLFSKDLVQLPTLRSRTMSETEKSSESRPA